MIKDKTETELINLRRQIYITIMSSVSDDECVHKFFKLKIEGHEEVLANMIIECCSQNRSIFFNLFFSFFDLQK